MSSPHEASVSVSGLHAVAGVVKARAEGLPLLLLDLDSFGAGVCLDAFLNVDFLGAVLVSGCFLERGSSLRSGLSGFFTQTKLFDTEVTPASPPLARKTRKQRPALDRKESQESGEVTAASPRLLRPLLPLDSSAECADEFGASFESR